MATEKTLADLLNITFRDNQADGSITASDMRDLIASVPYLTALGWEFRFDGQFTAGSPMTLADGVPQKITFTAQPGQDMRYPSTFPEIWDNANQKISIPTFLNGFGIIRLAFRANYAGGGQVPYINLTIDIGTDPLPPAGAGTASNIIYESSQPFAKTSGVQAFNFVVPLFGGTDFVTNGGQVIVESVGNTVDIYEIAITAGATFVPNPAGEG